MLFNLQSEYQPAGDQPQAIAELVEGVNNGTQAQTLLGVTGSGKTFTIANVIAETGRPTLVLSHNKTLAAQLYSEFKEFFPNNLTKVPHRQWYVVDVVKYLCRGSNPMWN